MTMGESDKPPRLSRRTVLAGAVGIPGVTGLAAAAPTDDSLTVMTRNVAIGVDLFEVLTVRTMRGLLATAGAMYDEFVEYPFSPRADAFAREIAVTEPHVVGIQEASMLRSGSHRDFVLPVTPTAQTIETEFLSELMAAISDQGLDYSVAVAQRTTDIELPADTDDGRLPIRVTDHVAILVHDSVTVLETGGGRFSSAVSVPQLPIGPTVERGYCHATIEVGDGVMSVWTTHLESSDATVRAEQTDELLSIIPVDKPIVLAGDFNSGPESSPDTYATLRERFEDAQTVVDPDTVAPTCCQDQNLRNEQSQLSRRIDGVLYEGALRPIDVERVGHREPDRVTVEGPDGEIHQWPSDHAGVVARFSIESESLPLATSFETTGGGSDDPAVGFGVLTAILALGYLVVRYRSTSREDQ